MYERAQSYQSLHTLGVLDTDEIRAMERFDGTRSSVSLTGGDTSGQ
jgi:hypothetical protein